MHIHIVTETHPDPTVHRGDYHIARDADHADDIYHELTAMSLANSEQFVIRRIRINVPETYMFEHRDLGTSGAVLNYVSTRWYGYTTKDADSEFAPTPANR